MGDGFLVSSIIIKSTEPLKLSKNYTGRFVPECGLGISVSFQAQTIVSIGRLAEKIVALTVRIIQINAKRKIEKIVHRAESIELKAILGLLLNLFAAEVLRVDLHRFGRQQSRFSTVPRQFVRLVRLVIWRKNKS